MDNDDIIGRGLLYAEAIQAEFRAELVRRLSRAPLRGEEIIRLARRILDRYEPAIAQALTETEVAAWVSGFSSVAERLPPDLDKFIGAEFTADDFLRPTAAPAPVPGRPTSEPLVRFPLLEEARESLLERQVLPRAQFDALDGDSRRRAFTVAGETASDALTTIRDAVAEAVDQGKTKEQFAKDLEERLHGSHLGPAHLETVFRTNVQTAYNEAADTIARNPVVRDVFPFREYLAIRDGRVRETHWAMTGLGLDRTGIYWADDPMWAAWLPPNGYNCRCDTNLLTIRQAARRGVTAAQEWLETGTEPPREYARISFEPDPGFAGSAGRLLASA